ncbi:MAG: SH3 domain-containing protein, partial [Thiohalocapsa sp.]
ECYALHEVRNLDPKGDGFLAVRSGPGSNYRMIDRLSNGDRVYVYTARGSWYGIVYLDGTKGWSHKNWLYQIAG